MSYIVGPADPRADAPVLHGRRRELDLLGDLLARLSAGHGNLVLVSGDAGIGKTALVETLTAEAVPQGIPTLQASAYDLEVSTPYSLWQDVARSAGRYPDLPPAPPALARPDGREILNSARDFWELATGWLAAAAACKPLLLILEDLHWADQSSIELLRFLARRMTARPVLLVATYRDVDLAPSYPLYHLLPHLVREARPTRMPLRPLSLEAARGIVRGRYPGLDPGGVERLAGYLDRYTEGNPLFIEELIGYLEEQRVLRPEGGAWRLGKLPDFAVPPLIRQIIEGRLERLGPDARRALQIAAVIGMEVPLDLWQRASTGTDAAASNAMEEALRSPVLEETGKLDTVRFRHALVRDAIYWNTNILHRHQWHARIGEIMAQRPEVDPGAVAHHFLQADDERAAGWLIEAAQRAGRAFAMQAAIEGYERALAILEQHPERAAEQAEVLCALAEAHRFTDTRRALTYISQAAGISERIDDPGIAVLTRWVHARIRGFDDQPVLDDLLAAADAFAALPEDERERIAASPLGYVVSDATLAQELANYGRFADAVERAERFLAARAAPTHRAQHIEFGNAFFGLGIARAALGEPEGARAAFERSRGYFRESGSFQMVSNSYYWELNAVSQIYDADRPGERHRLQREEVQANLSSEFIQTSTGERIDSTSETLILDGDWDACWQSASVRLTIPASRVPSARKLAEIDWLRGNAGRAWDHIRRALPAGPDEQPGRRFFLHRQELQCIAVELALDAGDTDLARRWIAAYERWLDWSGRTSGLAAAQLLRARWRLVLGEPENAALAARSALDLAADPLQALTRMRALRLLARIELELGKHEDAQTHLDEAIRLAKACATPYELAAGQVALVEAHGTGAGHDELLADAKATAERLGARPLIERIEQLKAAEAAARPPEIVAGLSPRELEVLQLLSRGMTDAEIADALYISKRTVHGHLNSIYGKLDVNSRTAAVARAFAEGIVSV